LTTQPASLPLTTQPASLAALTTLAASSTGSVVNGQHRQRKKPPPGEPDGGYAAVT
jgi:hypothetical protein